jgi:hypothetical protein
MSRLQTAFPDGAAFYWNEDGELCVCWSFDDPATVQDPFAHEPFPGHRELSRIERHMTVSDWVDQNTIAGTDYDVIATGGNDIVTVVLQRPTGGTSNGLTVGRRFILVRHEDVSKVSGTGVVAQGIQWPDGTVSMRWSNPGLPSSFACWDNIEAIERIHGHQGKTEIEWID